MTESTLLANSEAKKEKHVKKEMASKCNFTGILRFSYLQVLQGRCITSSYRVLIP